MKILIGTVRDYEYFEVEPQNIKFNKVLTKNGFYRICEIDFNYSDWDRIYKFKKTAMNIGFYKNQLSEELRDFVISNTVENYETLKLTVYFKSTFIPIIGYIGGINNFK